MASLGYEVKVVPVNSLGIDDSYQRTIQENWVRKTISKFDPLLVGTIIVNKRSDGDGYFIIDGQHRVAVLQEMDYTQVPAVVLQGLDVQEEAAIFYRMNRERLKTHPWVDFRARLVAREPIAREIDELVSSFDFHLGYSTDDRTVIGAIRAVEDGFRYTTDYCPTKGKALEMALGAIKANWPGRKWSLSAEIIRGLSRFFSIYPEVDPVLLGEVMSSTNPVVVMYTVRERAKMGHGHSAGYEVAAVMVELVNSWGDQVVLDPKKLGTRIQLAA